MNQEDRYKIDIITGKTRLDNIEKSIRRSRAFMIFDEGNDIKALLQTLNEEELKSIEKKLDVSSVFPLRQKLLLLGLIAKPEFRLNAKKFLQTHYTSKNKNDAQRILPQ